MAFLTFPPPTRFYISLMLFMASFINYTMIASFVINLRYMVNDLPGHNDENYPNYGPRYDWSENDQAYMLNAFFFGYILFGIPAGILSEHFGGKKVVGITLIVCAFLTTLIPSAAESGVTMVFVVRFFIGVFAGAMHPACHNLISEWAPPDERGKFVASIVGGSLAFVVIQPLSEALARNFGWNWSFYFVTLFSFLICFVWSLVVADNPANHRRITVKERDYIENSLRENLLKNKRLPPLSYILTSCPFVALIFLHFGNLWGFSFITSSAPKYLNEVLLLTYADTISALSLPHLSYILLGFMYGSVTDILRGYNSRHTTLIRKVFCVSSHILPGILLNLLAGIGKNTHYCLLVMAFALGFNGAAVVTNLVNCQDLAPNYAGTLFGIINTIGMTSGFLQPLAVKSLTSQFNTFDEWKGVFMIAGWMYIITAFIFICYGTTDVQLWNFYYYGRVPSTHIENNETETETLNKGEEKEKESKRGFKV